MNRTSKVTETTIRRATPLDAALLAQHRAALWSEVGEWDSAALAPHVSAWADFFGACIEAATYVAFIAERRGVIAGSGALLVHLTIPRPGSTAARAGRVQSVYVLPEARRCGVARKLMENVLGYARETKLVALSLHPSDAARPLYAAMGFEEVDEMRLIL